MAEVIKKPDFKLLHTADWHICNDFMEDATACLDFMIHHVMTETPGLDLIAIPGDIYNNRQIQQETFSALYSLNVIKRLANIAPVVIITGTPSHDGNAPMALGQVGGRFPVLVADKPGSWVLYQEPAFKNPNKYYFSPLDAGFIKPADIARAVISFTPAFTKQFFESGSDLATSNVEIANALGGIFAQLGLNYSEFSKETRANVPHILLGHYSIGGAFIHPSQPMIGKDIEISRDHLALANASINCLGHIHAAQEVNENTFYSGSLFSTDFGEYEDKGFYIHRLEGTDYGHTWAPFKSDFIKTPSPTLVKLEVDLVNNMVPDEMILQRVIMTADEVPEDAENAVIRLEVKIYQDKAEFIDEKAVHEYFNEMSPRSFKLNIIRIPRENVRSATIMATDRLREKIQARAEIIGGDDILLSQTVMEKADVLQDNPPDIILDQITKSLRKEEKTNETA